MSGTQGPQVIVNRHLKAFFEASDNSTGNPYGTVTNPFPLDAESVRVIGGKGARTRPIKDREDHYGIGGMPDAPIPLKTTGSASFSGYLQSSGVSLTEPDLATALKAGGFRLVTGGAPTVIAASPASTKTVLQVSVASGIPVGCPLAVTFSSNNDTQYAIVTVSDLGTPGVVTVSPPFSQVPASGDVVTLGLAYWLDDERDCPVPKSITAWVASNRYLASIAGLAPEKWSFNMGGDDSAKWDMEGTAARVLHYGSMQLDGAIVAGDLTLTVDDQTKLPSLSFIGSATYTLVDPAGVVADEHIRITATPTSTTLTVLRGQLGSVAAAFPDNSLLVPYKPDGIYTGNPLPALDGEIRMDVQGSGIILQVQTISVECGLAINAQEDRHGSGYKFDGYSMGRRDVSWSFLAWSRELQQLLPFLSDHQLGSSEGGTGVGGFPILAVQPVALGNVAGWFSPTVFLEIPDVDPGQNEVTYSMTGKAKQPLTTASLTDPTSEFCLFFI